MMRNPLLHETWQGISGKLGFGQIHLDYLNYLLLQGVVLFLWWPKNTLIRRLETENAPDTLLAVLIALGITMAYYSIRAGGEEILLPGQHSLPEWAIATPLALWRIVIGYLSGHIVQLLHAFMLSLPLLLMAYFVTGSNGYAVLICLLAVLVQASCFRLIGATFYLLIGHREALIFFCLRITLILIYGVIGVLFSPVSQWALTSQLLGGEPESLYLQGFFSTYGISCVLLICLIYFLLAQRRSAQAQHVSKVA